MLKKGAPELSGALYEVTALGNLWECHNYGADIYTHPRLAKIACSFQ